MNEMISINVRLFAIYRERLGFNQLVLDVPSESSLTAAIASLLDKFPSLGPLLSTTLFAVNQEYVEKDYVLSPGDEVVLIPPVSGGS